MVVMLRITMWTIKKKFEICHEDCIFSFLARLFVIARTSLLSCKKTYSKSIKGINTNLGIFAHHDKMQYLARQGAYNSESYCFGFMPLLTQTVQLIYCSVRTGPNKIVTSIIILKLFSVYFSICFRAINYGLICTGKVLHVQIMNTWFSCHIIRSYNMSQI